MFISRKTIFFAGVLVVAISIVGVAYANNGNDTIDACVNPAGQIRVVGGPGECNPQETALEWNVAGEQGPQGDTGPQGPPGPPISSLEDLTGIPCGGVATVELTYRENENGEIEIVFICQTWTPDPECIKNGNRNGQITFQGSLDNPEDILITALFEVRGKEECWDEPMGTGYLKLWWEPVCENLWIGDNGDPDDEIGMEALMELGDGWVVYGDIFHASENLRLLTRLNECGIPAWGEIDITYHGPNPHKNYNTESFQVDPIILQ